MDTLRDKAARAAKKLDRHRTPEQAMREFLRDHPGHADEAMRLMAKPVPKAGPPADPAIQLELPGTPPKRKRRRR